MVFDEIAKWDNHLKIKISPPCPSSDDGEIVVYLGSNGYEEIHKASEPLIVRRSNRVRRAPGNWWRSSLAVSSSHSVLISKDDPLSFQEAVGGPDAIFWKPAVQLEPAAQEKNETWKLAPGSEGKFVLTSKWVSNMKESEDVSGRTAAKAKAQQVAGGFHQK